MPSTRFVVRDVFRHALVDPVVPGLRRAGAAAARARQHVVELRLVVAGEVAELGGPPGGVAGRREQLVDLLGALVGRLVGQELRRFVGRRQRAGQVEADAAQELGVGAALRGDDAQLAELVDDQLVDLRRRRDAGILLADLVGDRADGRNRHDAVVVEGHDVRVARVAGGDHAVLVDRGDRLVVGGEAAERRDVFARAVGPVGDDLQLQLLAGLGRRSTRDGVMSSRWSLTMSDFSNFAPAAIQFRRT